MKKRFQAGISLIETLIVILIVLALAGVIFQLLIGGQMFYGGNEAKIQAQESARIAIARMVRELNEADSAFTYIRNDPAIGGSFQAVEGPADVFNGNSIIFQIPCRENSGGAEVVRLDEEKGEVVFGARDASGAWQPNYYIEYLLEVIEGVSPPTTSPPTTSPPTTSPPTTPPPTTPPPTTGPPEPIPIVITRFALIRKVWLAANIELDAGAANFLRISGTPVLESTVITGVHQLTFRANIGDHPNLVAITVTGWGFSAARRQGIESTVTTEVSFRN